MDDLCGRFGFHTIPCTREIEVAKRFHLPHLDEACDALRRTIENRMSGALIAPAGTGKTTVMRALVDSLPEARYQVHYIQVAKLSRRDMCRELTMALGLSSAGSYPGLVRRVQDRLLSHVDNDAVRPVLIFDDAHEFRADVLGILKTITNYEMDSRLVVSILLCGHNGLRTLLRREELEDVTGRLAHFATLRGLSREESKKYLEHRCAVAGGTTVPFDAHALEAIHEISRGNLRATDALARKALEIAHAQGQDTIDTTIIVAARAFVMP
jgi:type II secretory pathway predicted ATPase ExeA